MEVVVPLLLPEELELDLTVLPSLLLLDELELERVVVVLLVLDELLPVFVTELLLLPPEEFP